jgi:protein phosphatase
MLTLRSAARSDVGLIRRGNEDSGYAAPDLLVVADGMGGHAAGELASAAVVATLADEPMAALDADLLAATVRTSSTRIGHLVLERPELAGMGTTVTALIWQGDAAVIVHVGDSRAYRLRDGVLEQLTHDHTYVQTLIDAGHLDPAEAATHPRRSLLMRAIDGAADLEVDVIPEQPRVGDRYLLCSDGLTTVVGDDDIAFVLGDREPTAAVTSLVELALSRGAPDNVTVVVAHVIDVEPQAAERLRAVEPVVVGAAGEPRVRAQLPGVHFPDDAQPDPNRPDRPAPVFGPPTSEQPVLRILGGWSRDTPMRERLLRARRNRLVRFTALTAVIAVVLTAIVAVVGTVWWRAQWYVGVTGNYVTIFQGVPGSFIGIPLHAPQQVTGVDITTLPAFEAERVGDAIPAADLTDADRIVDGLAQRSAECQSPKPPAGCPRAEEAL